MASRRRAREFALQALYEVDISGAAIERALEDLWAGQLDGELSARPAEAEEITFATRLAVGVDRRKAEVDALIEGASLNWRLPRMPVVDRNILRLASFELLDCTDIPSSVSINEERFPKAGDVWESAGYATAQDRVDLSISVGAASVNVR